MTDRCEPPPELRDRDGWHWVCGQAGGEFIAEWRVADNAGLEPLWRIPLAGGTGTPEWAGKQLRWCYLSPVATPAEVAALRAERDEYRQFAKRVKKDDETNIAEIVALSGEAATLRARVAELEADNARLREALEPFAAVSRFFPTAKDWAQAGCIAFPAGVPDGPQTLTMGHMHAARAALGGTDNGR